MGAERAVDFLRGEISAFLDALLGVAQFGVALFDAELRYVWINDALARQNGLPPANTLACCSPNCSRTYATRFFRYSSASGTTV